MIRDKITARVIVGGLLLGPRSVDATAGPAS